MRIPHGDYACESGHWGLHTWRFDACPQMALRRISEMLLQGLQVQHVVEDVLPLFVWQVWLFVAAERDVEAEVDTTGVFSVARLSAFPEDSRR